MLPEPSAGFNFGLNEIGGPEGSLSGLGVHSWRGIDAPDTRNRPRRNRRLVSPGISEDVLHVTGSGSKKKVVGMSPSRESVQIKLP
jgi:hypothetical protein